MTIKLHNFIQLSMSKEFSQLSAHFQSFNPLRILRVDQYEIRHSNVISWLLDPTGNHGLGSKVFERVIGEMMIKPENERFYTDHAWLLKVASLTYNDWIIKREMKTDTNGFIDIVLLSEENKCALIIENKYYSRESDGQLNDYYSHIKKWHPTFTIIPIFLTLNADEPSDERYITLDYINLIDAIEFVMELEVDAVSVDISRFIDDYLEVLRDEKVPDPAMVKLANKVYTVHSEAILYLYTNFKEPKKKRNFHKRYEEMKNDTDGNEVIWQNHFYETNKETIDFIYEKGMEVLKKGFVLAMKEAYPNAPIIFPHETNPNFLHPSWHSYESRLTELADGQKYWRGYGLIIFFARTRDDRLKIYVEIGPLRYDNRLRLLESLETLGYTFREGSKKETSRYTRIYTAMLPVADWTSVDKVKNVLIALLDHQSFKIVIEDLEKALEKSNRII